MNNHQQPLKRYGKSHNGIDDALENMRRTDDNTIQNQTLTVLWLWILVLVFGGLAVGTFITGQYIIGTVSTLITTIFVICIVKLAKVY